MELSIHTLHISQADLLLQDHLVEGADEECIKEATMENCEANDSADKLEVVEMLWVDARVRVDLQSVVVVRRVFKQAIERVKHLMGKQEKEFSSRY